MLEIINLRPHHGLCIQHFIGKGYSKEFVEEMTKIIKKLETQENLKIKLVNFSDVICKACPHNDNGACKSGQKIIEYDNKCLSYCNLHEGDILSWQEYKALVKENILLKNNLSKVCVNCQWIDICKTFRYN